MSQNLVGRSIVLALGQGTSRWDEEARAEVARAIVGPLGEGGAVCAALEAHALPGLPAAARTLTGEERDMVKKADALARVRSARPPYL